MTTDRLTAADALIWHIQGDPVLRSPILAVGLLDRMPPWTRVRAAMARATDEIPRLRQRLDANPLGGRPQWVTTRGSASTTTSAASGRRRPTSGPCSTWPSPT